jgi:hypothetical protein
MIGTALRGPLHVAVGMFWLVGAARGHHLYPRSGPVRHHS